MRITPKTREQIASENLIPEGKYEALVESAADKTSESGNEMIVLKLRCYLPDGSERVISDWILEAFAAKLLDFVEAAGLEPQYAAGKLEARDCEGANVMLTIAHKKQTKGEYAEKVDRMDKHIMGGSDPNAGLLVRVKSVERDISRAQKSLSRVVWTFLSAIVGGIGLWVWERVKGHNP